MEYWEGKERCVVLGEYVADTGETVRNTAKRFGISKSTVHKDVTVRLEKVDRNLYEVVKSSLLKNKQERHLRGGEATRRKYQALQGRQPPEKQL